MSSYSHWQTISEPRKLIIIHKIAYLYFRRPPCQFAWVSPLQLPTLLAPFHSCLGHQCHVEESSLNTLRVLGSLCQKIDFIKVWAAVQITWHKWFWYRFLYHSETLISYGKEFHFFYLNTPWLMPLLFSSPRYLPDFFIKVAWYRQLSFLKNCIPKRLHTQHRQVPSYWLTFDSTLKQIRKYRIWWINSFLWS